MIREFGMSEEIGQVFFDSRHMQDGPLAVKVHEAAERIVRAQLDNALGILKGNREALDLLSRELLSKNRLTRSDLERILAAEPAPPAKAEP
jgi:ATP-dependent Zn protease